MSGIQWTTETWNPLTGCTRVSEGCTNCYAEQMAGRLKSMGVDQYQDAVHKPEGVDEWRWTGDITYATHRLDKPLRWTHDNLRIFVDSMSDLFHPEVDFEYIAAVFGVMAAAPDHTFQILTKRPRRMLRFFEWIESTWVDQFPTGENHPHFDNPIDANVALQHLPSSIELDDAWQCQTPELWPLDNIWLGVSAEHQEAADERIPPLLDTPAAVRFVSAEPLLGPIDLRDEWVADFCDCCDACGAFEYRQKGEAPTTVCCGGEIVSHEVPSLDWVITGGESGSEARPCAMEWVAKIRDQCGKAGVPVFIKQMGTNPVNGGRYGPGAAEKIKEHKGGKIEEWPEDLRVREFPEVAR